MSGDIKAPPVTDMILRNALATLRFQLPSRKKNSSVAVLINPLLVRDTGFHQMFHLHQNLSQQMLRDEKI